MKLPASIIFTTAILILGLIAGWGAATITPLPLPWMLGPLLITAIFVMVRPTAIPSGYQFPKRFRLIFIAIIGLMIGTQVTWDIVGNLPSYWPSLIAIVLFILAAQAFNMTVFQRLGGYDRATAYYCSAPGGLMESIALGEAAGCDVRLLTMQQFTRIILTLSSVPILVSFWVGEPVGSSAGLVLTGQDSGLPLWEDLLIAAAVGAVGLWIGKFLPAGHLMGPLIASAAIGLSGLATLALPQWVVIIAQVVIGTALGSRFGGMQFPAIRRAIGLSILSVGFMILLSFVISLILIRVTDMSFLVSMISFAPGGVTEMSLIALSLSANPAVVTLHHLVRISLTVFMISVLAKNFRKDPKTD